MIAVILAAGSGTRLLPLTADRPKALVELDGMTLLERLLMSCARAGIREALVVTGYDRGALESWLDRDLPLAVDTVFNEAFARYGNAWSLYTARDRLAGRDFIKLDGDLLLDSDILTRLMASDWPSALVLDRDVALDDEAMKASTDARGRVTAIGKWLDTGAGESIGVEKIAATAAPRLFGAIERLVLEQGRHDAYYEDAYQALIEEGWELGSIDVAGAAWVEIDDHQDLARALAAL